MTEAKEDSNQNVINIEYQNSTVTCEINKGLIAVLAPYTIQPPKYCPFCSFGPQANFDQVNVDVDATCVIFIF